MPRKGFNDRNKELDEAFNKGNMENLPKEILLEYLGTIAEHQTDNLAKQQSNLTRSNYIMNILNSRNASSINMRSSILTGVIIILTAAAVYVSYLQVKSSNETTKLIRDFIRSIEIQTQK